MNAQHKNLKTCVAYFCLEELAKLLGFWSERARQYCKQAGDHHKALEMIEVVAHATNDELLIPYVHECYFLEQSLQLMVFLTGPRNKKTKTIYCLQILLWILHYPFTPSARYEEEQFFSNYGR